MTYLKNLASPRSQKGQTGDAWTCCSSMCDLMSASVSPSWPHNSHVCRGQLPPSLAEAIRRLVLAWVYKKYKYAVGRQNLYDKSVNLTISQYLRS